MHRARLWNCVFSLFGLSLISGCVSAFQVSEDRKGQGLPFYVKTVRYRQHSLYDYPWVRVSLSSAPILEIKDGAEKLGAQTVRIVDVADDSASRKQILELQQLVAELQTTPSNPLRDLPALIQNAFVTLTKHSLPTSHLDMPAGNALRRVGNFVERVSVVDYAKPHYLNARVPIFGSTNLAAELAADGTLAKGSNNVTGGGSEALGAVVSALTGLAPIKEVLTAKWVPTKSGNDPQRFKENKAHKPASEYALRYEIKVEQQSVTYDFTVDHMNEPSGTTLGLIKANFETGLFTVKAAEKASEKAPDNALSFSGKVQLPDAKKQ